MSGVFRACSLFVFALSIIASSYGSNTKAAYDTVFVRNDSMFFYSLSQKPTGILWNGNYFYLKSKGPCKSESVTVGGYEISSTRKNGKWEFYFEGGSLWKKGVYKDEREEGLWIEYFSNGKVFRKKVFKKGNEDGIRETYNEQGNLVERKPYKAGVFREKGKEVYYNADGIKFKEFELNGKGIYDGKYTEWTPDGKLRQTGFYKEGKDFGKWISYRGNGEIEGVAEMKDTENFTIIKYYEGGVKYMEGTITNGNLEGKFVQYYQTGKVEKTGNFHQGLKDGEWIYFDLDGKILKTEIFKDDHLIDRKF